MITKWIPVIGVCALATSAFGKPAAKKVCATNAATVVSTDDYAGSGNVSAFPSAETIYDATNTGNWDLQGIAAGVDGQLITIRPSDGNDMTIVNTSGSASAGDKIITPDGNNMVTDKEGVATFYYDTAADSGNGAWIVASFVE